MPKFDLTNEQGSARDQFVATLRRAEDTYNPVEELLELQRELIELERKYGLSSNDFDQRYRSGAMGDSVEVVYWAGLHRAYLQLKQAIDESSATYRPV